MAANRFEAVRLASDKDPQLAAALAEANSIEEWVQIATENGFEVDIADLPPVGDASEHELSDAELAGVSGGYTFPRTDWIYCDNPWTNYWCTLRC